MVYYIFIVLVSTYIMWMDIRYRRIPNKAIAILLFIGFFYLLSLQGSDKFAKGGVIVPVLTLLVGIGLSYKNIIGMGDVKFLFVTLLLCPENWQVAIIYFVSFAGGIWSLLWYLVLRRIAQIKRFDTVRKGIPYGIPIALALCTFTFVG